MSGDCALSTTRSPSTRVVSAVGVAEPPGVSAERRSIVRVAAALDALARCSAEGLSVDDLAEGISSGRATAARLLDALGDLGLARRLAGDRYVAGAELLIWAARLGRGGGIGPVASDLLAELAFEAQRFDRFSPTTIVDRSALRADLERVRERGYAVSLGERIPEASGIAAPFFTDGVVAGAITITIPQHRFDPERTEEYGTRAVTAATELTRLLTAGTLFT
jgi:DNA-binding IclR family transcriptional regulator